MNFSNIDRLPRISKEETKELVKKHPGLRNLFPKKGVVWHCSQDVLLDGFVSSSRFSNPELSSNRPSSKITSQVDHDNIHDHDDESETDSSYMNEHHVNDSSSHKEQKRKFAISLATLAAKPYKRSIIAKDGGIKTLLDLSCMSDSIIRRSCSIALTLLSKEPMLRPKMVDDGVIASLVSLSSTHNYYLKMNCVQALCNIFCESGAEARAIRDGAAQALIRIAAVCPDSIEYCLLALVNLSSVAEKFPRIEELNEVLFYFNDAAILSDHQRLLLLSVLCNLSAIRNNQLRLVEDGCLRMVEWAWSSSNPDMRIRGSEIIRNLTTEYRARGKLVENNLITMLLAMANDDIEDVRVCAVKALYILSKDSSCRQKIVSGNGMDVLLMLSTSTYQNIEIGRTTARVWRILCKDPNAAPKAVTFGIIKAFVSLLTTTGDDQHIQQYVIESICMLLAHHDIHLVELVLADSILTVIVMLIRSYRDSITSEWLAYALYLITSVDINNHIITDYKVMESGVLPSLIKLSCSLNSSENTKCLCSGCFVNLTLMKDIDAVKAIPILVYLLRNEKNMITRMNCSTSLYNLSYNDDNCYQMLDAGVLMPIVEFVVKSDRDENLLTSSKARPSSIQPPVTSSSHDNNHHNASLELSKAPSMSNLLTSLSHAEFSSNETTTSSIKDLIRTKIKCAAILSRLTLFEKYYHLFINNNHDIQLLHVLLKLSIVDDLPTQRRVVSALANLTKNPFLRAKLLSLNPISYILSLASKRDEKLWYGCCCIICNLSYEHGSEKVMVQGGIVPTLLITALINTDSISSKIICVKALANLLSSSSSSPSIKDHDNEYDDDEYDDDYNDEDRSSYQYIQSSMVHDGVIWGLSSLAMLDNKELLSICIKILFRISHDHARDIMESAAAIRALIKIINDPYHDIELLRLGGEILMNILLKTHTSSSSSSSSSSSVKDHNFRANIVHHMKTLASSDDAEVMISCINCLYLISESNPICCKMIVSSGILHLVNHGSYDKSVIFSSKIISLSYLTLINNIAKAYYDDHMVSSSSSTSSSSSSSSSSSKPEQDDDSNLLSSSLSNYDILSSLLDEEFLSRVHRIVAHGDEELDITAMKGIYIFTCHHHTIIKLAHEEHHIISLIDDIWHRDSYEKSIELIELIVAVLFNISSCDMIQASMVSQGIVKLLSSIWTFVYDNAYLDDDMIHIITTYALSTATMNNNVAGNNVPTGLNSNNMMSNNMMNNNNRASVKMMPAATIKVNKPVAGLSLTNISSPTSSSSSKNATRLSFSPTNSSFYAISNSSLNNGSVVTGYNTVTTLNINFNHHHPANNNMMTDNHLTINIQEALELITNHQIFMKLCILICSSISHLGCGNINSNKMIEDGCGAILVFITQSHKHTNFLNYIFDYPVYHRCSAAFRNLLLSISNQAELLHKGCLQGLIDLFALITRAEQQSIAVETTATVNNITSSSSSSSSSYLPSSSNAMNNISRSERAVRLMISKNCASALRSLTYNHDERSSLIASGAIHVILADLKEELADDDDTSSINHHLLHEIEAESWQNGIRRQQREERAKVIPTASPCLDYLNAEPFRQQIIDIPVDIRSNLIEKFYVSDMESYDEEVPTNDNVGKNGQQLLQFQQLDDTISVINIKLDDLESYEEYDDMSHAITQQYPKCECHINDDDLLHQLKMSDAKENNNNDNERGMMGTPGPIITSSYGDMIESEQSMCSVSSSKEGLASASVIENDSLQLLTRSLVLPIGSSSSSTTSTSSINQHNKIMLLNDINTSSAMIYSPKNNNKESLLTKDNDKPSCNNDVPIGSPSKRLPMISSSKPRTTQSSSSQVKTSTATKASVIPDKFKKIKKDKFSEIVAKINASKDGDSDPHGNIDQVLSDWKTLCGRR